MTRDTADFVIQLRLHASGRGDDDRLFTAFLEAAFYCQAPEHPGFLAIPTRHGPMIPAFTSEGALASHAGASRWFSTSGADLVSLAPVGHRFVIDPGTPHQVVVDPTALLRQAAGPAA
jgi:hypothetical protein